MRRTPITKKDLDDYGLSENCPRCEHTLRYGHGRTTKGHSEQCRSRIYEQMLTPEAGQVRIAKMGQAQLELMTKFQELLERRRQAQGEKKGMSVPDPLNFNLIPNMPWGSRSLRVRI